MIYAYARVSAKDQNLQRQFAAFQEFGIEKRRIFSEKESGKDFERKEYKRLLKRLKSGDLLVINSIDRLGRNYSRIIEEWNRITNVIGADILVLDMPLLVWSIKSTTKAQDGLYVYDTVQRLYDSQFGEGDVADIKQYIKLGKLGEAFASDVQTVLLIDEIDKADLEFPNDLLWELDKMEFYIHETKETIKTKHRPIVIITSNAEKELPDAFLRRCIFHYIEFPSLNKMEEIIRVHFKDIDQKLCDNAMKAFYKLRSVRDLAKKPSTSELLDWIQALIISGIDPKVLEHRIPFIGVLLKKNQDIDLTDGGKRCF